MSDLFALSMPWWEFILRAVVVYVVVLTMVRVAGKRALGQFTPFDMLLLVLLGNAVQNALLGRDTSLGGGILLAALLNGVVCIFLCLRAPDFLLACRNWLWRKPGEPSV